MDDKLNPGETQPVFDSHATPLPDNPDNASPEPSSLPNENLIPEEVPPEVVSATNEEATDQGPNIPQEVPPPEDNRGKLIVLLVSGAVFVFFFLLIFRALFSGSRVKKPVALLYWGLWEDKQIMDPLISDYERKNPNIKISYEKMSPQDYREKLVARKTGGPDIFRFHNTWLPEIRELASPLPANIMSVTQFEKTFYKIHQRDLKVGKYYYGLPLMIDGLVLIVNDSLLKKAGVEKIPSTWDELLDAVVKLTVKENGGKLVTSGIAVGTAGNVDHFSDIFGLMLLQNGGDIRRLTAPEAVEALQSYRKFAEAPNNFWDESMPASTLAFAEEKTGMIIAPSWEIITVKTINPDIHLKVVPIPSVPGGKPVSLASYWVEGVSRYSQNQIEAWKFLKYLSDKENMTKLYENESKVRLFGEPYSRVDLGATLVQNEYIGTVIKQADVYSSLPMIARTYDHGLNDGVVQYIENAVNATIQGVSYKEALNTAQQGVTQLFKQYRVE
ncbi:sugar ABC transporter substrate-binding protein [Candidatus Roizmanbacteria bacterium]|nr:sugar ABC transporter substrate-binding protein [Candidatus Roizmanbacteria bacterium]